MASIEEKVTKLVEPIIENLGYELYDVEYAKEGKLAHQEADLLNYHLAISHSQLEDPLLFVVMGLPIGWLIFPRVVLAIIVVWIRRGIYGLRAHAHPVVKVENVSI